MDNVIKREELSDESLEEVGGGMWFKNECPWCGRKTTLYILRHEGCPNCGGTIDDVDDEDEDVIL